jgi:hypothetical protein
MGGSFVKTVAALAAVAAVAIVAPVQAHSPKPHPPKSHKCTPHAVSYRVGGTLMSGSLTKDAGTKKTYSGSLMVEVLRANKHAKSDKGTSKLYTLAQTKVHFGKGVDPAALVANSRVNLRGNITTLAKKCDQTGFTPTITIKKADIKAPKPPKAPKSATSA